MKWEIELYKTAYKRYPVLDYIQSLQPKQRAKIEKVIDLLELYGIYLPHPYAKKIKGSRYKGLWELRISCDKSKYRIIYFLYMNNVFILLSAFCKKECKISKYELELSRKRMVDYLIRNKEKK
jgi:phage-related protein